MLRHAGLMTSSAIAELERLSRVACSDLLDHVVLITLFGMPRHAGSVRNYLAAVTYDQVDTVSEPIVRIRAGGDNGPDTVGVLRGSIIC